LSGKICEKIYDFKEVESMNKPFTGKFTVAAILIMGILASLMQFICNRSMYADEALLAFNIMQKNSFELLQPLDYVQVAPVLFLQIEKIFSMILPNSEYGLRLFPLLCFWASIYFFYQIAGKLFNNVFALIIALSFFCLGHIFIYYSSEVKQYMSDVFVLLCIFYFLLKDYKKDTTRYYLLGIIGV
jgi:4-amino-4-deoxy-L-arabinose transferase-like glycosyltransferase